MSKITEVRLTLAALIYGIEIDLKATINKYIVSYYSDLSFLRNQELIQKVEERFEKENPKVNILNNIDLAIDYLDFQDAFQILHKNADILPTQTSEYIKKNLPVLSEITPIRNRVMHTRPLLSGDFATVYGFITELKKNDPIAWNISIETREKIEKDPSYVLTLSVPTLTYDREETKVIHNLPTPDFDETGFIGRKNDITDLKKLIFSTKVVSIIGDGGIGKTALALKIAYDIIDLKEECPFELVIWTSAKTTMLTAKGIEEIHSTITNYTGLIDVLSDTLKTEEGKTENEKLQDILEYLGLFKTLLIIDNLETIQSEDIREFIRQAQMRCNIVITSRIGLGELEYPRKLKGLSEVESAKLIREIARIRNSETLLKLPQSTLIEIAEKLYYNPLALKWFVNTVEVGISPNEVLNNKDDLLNFCLSNVYEKLSEGSISILNTIRAARRNLRTAEIIYLSEHPPLEVRKFLIELFKTTLISREILDGNNIEDTSYFITDFAKDYLSQNHPLEADYIKSITRKSKELSSSVTQIKKIADFNEFSIYALTYRNTDERIAAKFLSEALELSKKSNYIDALKKVTESKNIVPNYFESYRVGAFIKASNGDLLGAEEDYLLGLEIEPENPRLLYYYSQFLLFQLEETDKALIYANKLLKVKPNHPYITFLFVRIYNTQQEYGKGVHLLKELLNKELDQHNKRVAYTELISLYAHMAQSFVKIEFDHTNAINHYKKAVSIFEDCVKNNILDPKMIKNFCEALSLFMNMPINTIEAEQEFIKQNIVEHDSMISLTQLKDKLILKYADKFDDQSLNYLIDDQGKNVQRRIGTIIKNKTEEPKFFVFIESDGERLYANMREFIDVNTTSQWNSLKNYQMVTFEVGENNLGKCAKNIMLA